MSSAATYLERQWVPLSWWLLGAAFVASSWLALTVALPAALTWSLTIAIALGVSALLLGYGGARVQAGPAGLTAGRAVLEWSACGLATALDAESTRRLHGVDADARAYLLVRPYLDRAVRVEVDDSDDSTPYWLISTRHPERLVQAIQQARRPA